MTTFTFMVCSEPYKYEAMDSLLKIAESLVLKGHEIKGIFLFGSGVYNLHKDLNLGNDTRDLPDKLEKFCLEHDIKVVGCSTWIGICGLKQDTFIKGGAEEGLGDLSNMVAESDKFIVFGAGL
ncbi:MAG: DsrE/DsrF/TusD sulfur relay family protein [Promethearchaeota archaeon]